MKVENTYKDWFASLLGSAAMIYAGYGWHMEWISSKEAGIVAFIGFVLLFLRTRLTQVIGKGLEKIFDAVMNKIFGKGGTPPTAVILLMLMAFASISFAQTGGNKPVNTPAIRFTPTTSDDSTSTFGSTIGILRYDEVTGEYRFFDALSGTWFTYAKQPGWKTDGTTFVQNPWIVTETGEILMLAGDETFSSQVSYIDMLTTGISITSSGSDGSTDASLSIRNSTSADVDLHSNNVIHLRSPRVAFRTTTDIDFGTSDNASATRNFNAVGSLANIDLNFLPKGTGKFKTTNLTLTSVPTNDDTETAILVRDAATGNIEYRTASSLGGTYTAAQGLTLSGTEFRLGGTLTGGTLSQITSTSGNGLYVSMGSGVGTSTGSWQISPAFSVMKHQVGGGDLVEYIQQSGVGEFTGKHRLVTAPFNDNSSTKALTRDATTGDIEQMDIGSGTYTPTFTSASNLDATPSADGSWWYSRTGKVVEVAGYFTVDVTTGGAGSSVRISLPIAVDMLNTVSLGGTGWTGGDDVIMQVSGDNINDVAFVNFTSSTTTSQQCFVKFSYYIN